MAFSPSTTGDPVTLTIDSPSTGSINAASIGASAVDGLKIGITPAMFNPFPAPDSSEEDFPAKDSSGKELPQTWLLLAKDIAGKNLDELRQTWEGIFASDEAFPTTDWLPEPKTGWMRHPLLREWFFQVHDFEYGPKGTVTVLNCRGPWKSRARCSDPARLTPYGFYVTGNSALEVMTKFLLIAASYPCR